MSGAISYHTCNQPPSTPNLHTHCHKRWMRRWSRIRRPSSRPIGTRTPPPRFSTWTPPRQDVRVVRAYGSRGVLAGLRPPAHRLLSFHQHIQPEGWLDDEPDMVPDAEAAMPEEWEEAEDGVWEAPMVYNPKVRCGGGRSGGGCAIGRPLPSAAFLIHPTHTRSARRRPGAGSGSGR